MMQQKWKGRESGKLVNFVDKLKSWSYPTKIDHDIVEGEKW